MDQDKIRLAHIKDSVSAIEEFARGKTLDDFVESRMLRNAIVREFEVIGEAIKHISLEFRNQHKDIPWRTIAGMRDVIVHEYFQLDPEVVWDATKEDLPALKAFIEKFER